MATENIHQRNWFLVGRVVTLMLLISVVFAPRAHSTEGATSFYFPGLYGDFGVALMPDPGIYVFNTGAYYQAMVNSPILALPADQTFDGFAYVNLIRGFHVFDRKFLGARYAIGIRIPQVRIELDVELNSPLGSIKTAVDTTGRGDLGFIPASLYWSKGHFSANFYHTVTAPTGEFNITKFPNASRNHWSFDTVLAMSWTDLQKGVEFAAVPGVIINAENPDTQYRSGSEFHVDLMANKLLTPAFGIGLHGSYYRQITDDSGAGARLGGFRGRASSIGPAFLFRPRVGSQRAYFTLKWLHEFDVKNRFKGNLYIFTGGLKF